MDYLFYICTFIPIILAFLTSIYTLYIRKGKRYNNLPSGWIIGCIWILIFALLGYSLYISIKRNNLYVIMIIISIFCLCLAYPYYTNNFQNKNIMFFGNIVTFVYILCCFIYISIDIPVIIKYMIPLLVWFFYIIGISFLFP